MDLLLLQHLAAELDERLRGSRIEQVYALPKKDVVLVAGRRSGPRLWFSAEPDQPHLYLRDGSHPPRSAPRGSPWPPAICSVDVASPPSPG